MPIHANPCQSAPKGSSKGVPGIFGKGFSEGVLWAFGKGILLQRSPSGESLALLCQVSKLPTKTCTHVCVYPENFGL